MAFLFHKKFTAAKSEGNRSNVCMTNWRCIDGKNELEQKLTGSIKSGSASPVNAEKLQSKSTNTNLKSDSFHIVAACDALDLDSTAAADAEGGDDCNDTGDDNPIEKPTSKDDQVQAFSGSDLTEEQLPQPPSPSQRSPPSPPSPPSQRAPSPPPPPSQRSPSPPPSPPSHRAPSPPPPPSQRSPPLSSSPSRSSSSSPLPSPRSPPPPLPPPPLPSRLLSPSPRAPRLPAPPPRLHESDDAFTDDSDPEDEWAQLYFYWCWKTDNGCWDIYDVDESNAIELQFARKGSILLKNQTGVYCVDTKQMTQKNTQTKFIREIKRVSSVQENESIQLRLLAANCLTWSFITYLIPSDSGNGCRWFWEGDDFSFQLYDDYDVSSEAIEQKYENKLSGKFKFTHNEFSYVINFSDMTQKNRQTGRCRRVRRVTSGSSTADESACALWFWKDHNGDWQPISNLYGTSSAEIESYYSNGNDFMRYQGSRSGIRLVDFARMIEVNIRAGRCWDIQRRGTQIAAATAADSAPAVIRTIVYPSLWASDSEALTSDVYQLTDVTLDVETMAEYCQVAHLFEESMPEATIQWIKRIENRELWASYYVQKVRLEARLGVKAVKRLFHGTMKINTDAICARGFDWRLYGRANGTLYGRGSYFARDASYSQNYTDCNTMFVAQVLVGDYAVGNQNMVRPPPKDQSNPRGQLFDSCVNDLQDPSIFVTFECSHSYPEYLIKYQ